jgi:hypothetical protein
LPWWKRLACAGRYEGQPSPSTGRFLVSGDLDEALSVADGEVTEEVKRCREQHRAGEGKAGTRTGPPGKLVPWLDPGSLRRFVPKV